MPGPISESYEGPSDEPVKLPAWAFAPLEKKGMQPNEQINKLVEEYGIRFVLRQLSIYAFQKEDHERRHGSGDEARWWDLMFRILDAAAESSVPRK